MQDIPIIEALSDASRLITDFIHDEISIRRSLVLTNVTVPMRNVLNAAVADDWLFGGKLVDDLKTAKLIEQSAEDLKKPPQQRFPKNSKGPPRVQNKAQVPASGGQKQSTSSTHRRRAGQTEHTRQAEHTRQTKPTRHATRERSSHRNGNKRPRYPKRH